MIILNNQFKIMQEQNLQALGLYDRPRIVQPAQKSDDTTHQRLKIVFETDDQNNGLVTNPHAMWKLLRADKFLAQESAHQITVLEILNSNIQKCANNCCILADNSSGSSTALRLNHKVINMLQQNVLPNFEEPQGCQQDILFQLLLIGLNVDYPQIQEAVKILHLNGVVFERCHIELIYQYVRVSPTQNIQRALNLLTALLEQQGIHNTPQNFFYFNGFLSGILLNQKTTQPWQFNKGFAACMWFNLSSFSAEGKMQDNQNLPVLFNCYSQGQGGFECYFNQQKLYYRILPPSVYQPPTSDSNGILISEFQPNKWNFLAIEHDKPLLTRAQLIALINDKQVVNQSMDYPKFDKNAKLTQACVCNNYIGQMSNFILFKEQINNPQKFVQIYKNHFQDFKQFDLNIFDQRLQEKLFLMYSPNRTNGKIVFDCIDMNDGELLINCGVWIANNPQKRPLLKEQGGIESLLVLLDKCNNSDQVNQFLKILISVLSVQPDYQIKSNLFQILFTLIQNLPHTAVNCLSVQLLTELRFTVQDRKQNEIFFKNLLMSADFWISTNNFEVMQEYWSFVKSIYSQNPIQHNIIFPIHNLISLMVKISDTQQQYCCTYHKRTHEIFYGNSNDNQSTGLLKTQIDKYLEPIVSVLECVLTSGGEEILVQIDHITRSLTHKTCPCYHIQILKLLKVLLLDSKSHHECASPLEFAQRFLNANGLQILLYLCANNAALDVKAMCIKLIDVLSSHSSLIQMRIDTDLITYLSHVLLPINLFQKQIPQINQLQGSQYENFYGNSNQQKYYLMGADELTSPQKSLGLKFFSYQEAVAEEDDHKDNYSEQEVIQSDSFEIIDPQNKQIFSKTLNNFKSSNINDLDMNVSDKIVNSTDGFELQKVENDKNESESSDMFIAPPPKTSKHKAGQGFKFGGKAFADLESSDKQSSEENEEKNSNTEEQTKSNKSKISSEDQEDKQIKNKQSSFTPTIPSKLKPKGLINLQLPDDNDQNDGEFRAPPSRAEHQKKFGERILGDFNSDDDVATAKRKDEEAPKPTVDVLMSRNLRSGIGKGFDFGKMASDSDQNSEKQDSENEKAEEESKDVVVEEKPIVTQTKKKFGSNLTAKKLSLQNNDDDEDEQVIMKIPPKKSAPAGRNLSLNLQIDAELQSNRLVGTTGATNDLDFDEQSSVNNFQQRKPAYKKAPNLKLDTDKINDLFTFGGEKGEMKEEQANEKLEDDIMELALICVTAMRKKKTQQTQQANKIQILLQRPDKNFGSSSEHGLLNTNQTVKGIKKIELEHQRLQKPLNLPDVLEEDIIQSQQYSPSYQEILSVTDPIVRSYQFPNSLMSETSKSQIDEFTGELENLYTSCLEWILNRAPSGLFKTMMVDDFDKITFLPAMQVLMILVSHSNNLVRQRALQDMFMLAQWDSQNGQVLLQHKAFHSWLLELLTPYQQERQSESAKAVYDMGTKLHTLLLKNSCTSTDEDDGFKKINLLARWPAVVAEKGLEYQSAHDLSRSLIISLCNSLSSTQLNSVFALKNLTHLTLQVHELILSSSVVNQNNRADQKQGHNESVLQWVLKTYLRYNYNELETANMWTDWKLCSSIVQSWDNFFLGHKLLNEEEKDSILVEKSIRSLLFGKSQDELNEIIDLLMQGDQNATSSQSEQIQAPQKSYPQRFLSLGGFSNKPNKEQNSTSRVSAFTLQAIINISCLALTQATAQGDKSLLKQWLARLELYFKYTMIVSELWKNKNLQDEQHYSKVQRKISEICSFILAFLFQEIHTNQTPKSTQPSTFPNGAGRSDSTPSPQSDNIHKSKIYQSCLKSCLIFMINLAGIQQDQPGSNERAIQIILQQILVKQYSNSSKPLINNQDISRFIESNFEEFPECFQQNDWKIAFFHNSLINNAISSQLNVEMIDSFRKKRLQYAIRLKEAEVSTAQANDEILKKIQADTLQAISDVTHQEHDTASQSDLLLDFHQRAIQNTVSQWVKQLSGQRGTWQYKPKQVFQKIQNQMLGEGQRCLLKDVNSNGFSLLKDRSIEPQIFREIHNHPLFLSRQQSDNFKYFTRKLTKIQLEDLQFSSKEQLKNNLINCLQPTRKIILECENVSMLRSLEKRTGTLIMTNFELIFVYDITGDESNATIFFFQWQPTKKLNKQVSLSDIKEIQKRRFLGQNKALELFLMSNKTLLLDFKDVEQRDQFAKKLLRQRQNKCKNLIYYTSLDHKWVLKKSNLTDDWVNHRISNFKYLMCLNQLASRSYHDLSQYPVFPWIINTLDKKDKPSSQLPSLNETTMRGGAPPIDFRDLSKNMQMLGSPERQAEFKRKYEDLDGFSGMDDRFHCGSHYSNPGIVLHYLARLQPILEANVVLQSNAMDHPDRIFQSIQKSYFHSLNDFSDVRELIPEFYCLSEMFVNNNHCNFGTKDDGTKVNHVILPEWSAQNPNKFVEIMREALESNYVSQNLNTWIDFIFGYKQRDQDAVNCLNTFSKITYQVDQPGDFDIMTIQDQNMRAAMENQGYNFGQTPMQLFKEKHPVRLDQLSALKSNLVVDEISKLKIFKPVPVNLSQPSGNKNSVLTQSLISPEAIMFAKFIDNDKIIGAKKEGYAQNFVWLPRAHDQNPQISFSLGSDRKQKFNGREIDMGMDQIDRSTKKFDYPMTISITKDGNYIVKGGYWDGRVIFCPIEGATVTQFELTAHKNTVTVIATDQNEQTLITGTKTGEVIVWRNSNYDCLLEAQSPANPWVNLKQLNDHERQVTSIFINEEMCLFVTSSVDSFVNLYNLWTAEILRTFSHPSQMPIYSAVLAQSPLPLCAFYSRDDHMWYAYSLNGSSLTDPLQEKKERYEESSHIVQPIVIKSSNQLDKLVYGTERGCICMRSLPNLERYRKLQVSKDYPVLTLLVSPDRRFLLTGCGDGGLIVITERGDQNQQSTTTIQTQTGFRSTRNSGQGSLSSSQTNQSSLLNSISSFVGAASGSTSRQLLGNNFHTSQ